MKYRHFWAALAAFSLLSLNAWAAPKKSAKSAAPATPYEAAVQKLSDKDPSVRRQGADALGEMRNPEAAPALIRVLTDVSPQVRSSAVDALGVMRFQCAGAVIAKMLETDKDATVRQTAAIALGYMGNRALISSLLKGLDDPHDGTRFASVNSLGILRDPSTSKALAEKLKDPDPRMRKSASYALSRLQDKSAVPALLESLKQSRSTETALNGQPKGDATVAASMLRSLGEMGDKAMIPKVKPFMEDPDPSVRIAAAHSLYLLGDSTGLPMARKFLKDKNSGSRKMAVDILGHMGAPSDLAALRGMGDDPDPQVKESLKSAIQFLSPRPASPKKQKR